MVNENEYTKNESNEPSTPKKSKERTPIKGKRKEPKCPEAPKKIQKQRHGEHANLESAKKLRFDDYDTKYHLGCSSMDFFKHNYDPRKDDDNDDKKVSKIPVSVPA
jgi:hypothetical protein